MALIVSIGITSDGWRYESQENSRISVFIARV